MSDERWSPVTRIAFRFFFAYFCLFFLTDRIAAIVPFQEIFARGYSAHWLSIVAWLESHLLHTGHEIYRLDGVMRIGNTAAGTILCLCYLASAAIVTAVWSVLDRRRLRYGRLHQLFRYFLRFSLAFTMMHYGAIKIVPTQMLEPPLSALTEPLGDFTRMRLLWTYTGASPVYETLVGCAEFLGGALLLFSRTALLGGLLCCANLSMIFILNMCYDVQVKLYSFHLLAMAALLVAPDLPRLADLFVLNRPVAPPRRPPLFANPWLSRGAQALLVASCLYETCTTFQGAWKRYEKHHPPPPPLYGVWTVEELAVDGREVSAGGDPLRWRWLTFETPGRLVTENMAGRRERHVLDLSLKERILVLRGSKTARFSFVEPGEDELLLDGVLDGHPARVKLRKMALISKPFHWIFEVPKEDR